MTPSTTILDKAAMCFTAARRNVYEGAALLYKIDQEKLWEQQYGSFGEYVEEECQISQGYASKLLQSWKFYVIEGGLSQAKLQEVDAEKLYLALKLPSGTPEQRLVKAQTWSRQDFRAEKKDECTNHEFEMFCKHCWKHE